MEMTLRGFLAVRDAVMAVKFPPIRVIVSAPRKKRATRKILDADGLVAVQSNETARVVEAAKAHKPRIITVTGEEARRFKASHAK